MTPEVLAPPFFVAAGLLAVSGLAKLRHPRPTAKAMYAAGLPGSSNLTARTLGGGELLIGVLALARPVPLIVWALAAMYLLFAGFLGYLIWARPGSTSCGCAGEREVPPNVIHLGLDAVAAVLAGSVALNGVPNLAAFTIELGWAGVPFLAGLIATGVSATVVATELPAALAAYRPPPRHTDDQGDPGRHRRAD